MENGKWQIEYVKNQLKWRT